MSLSSSHRRRGQESLSGTHARTHELASRPLQPPHERRFSKKEGVLCNPRRGDGCGHSRACRPGHRAKDDDRAMREDVRNGREDPSLFLYLCLSPWSVFVFKSVMMMLVVERLTILATLADMLTNTFLCVRESELSPSSFLLLMSLTSPQM